MTRLAVENLRITFGGNIPAVDGVSFAIERGKVLAIVGESGSGKSMTSLALMGLLPRGARMSATTMRLGDLDLTASSTRMTDIRGRRMAMIFQDPMTCLNPVYTIGNQLEEVYLQHNGGRRSAARERAIYLLDRVGVPMARERLRQYPHQMSGGLRQRVMIAMALMCEPEFLIADEPTTALDVTTQIQVLDLLTELKDDFGLGLLLITHDLGVVARIAGEVCVMRRGVFVETGGVADVFANPQHAYTRQLLDAVPVLGQPKKRLLPDGALSS